MGLAPNGCLVQAAVPVQKLVPALARAPAEGALGLANANPLEMLRDVHSYIKDKEDTGKWLRELPVVFLKPSHVVMLVLSPFRGPEEKMINKMVSEGPGDHYFTIF